MPTFSTKLHQPLDAIIFDCDSTLSTIEGIDKLAQHQGVDKQVQALTARAMAETGLTVDVYRQRLELVRPTRSQVDALGLEYELNLTPGADALIQQLHQLGKHVFIVSAGLFPAVLQLASRLQIAPTNVFAVDISFDDDGNYLGFDAESPLATNRGKNEIVKLIKNDNPRLGYVGDGLNDVAVIGSVCVFVGYGGVCYRPLVEEKSTHYVKEGPITNVAPYLLTEAELERVNKSDQMTGQ